jgi:hypothetical protein
MAKNCAQWNYLVIKVALNYTDKYKIKREYYAEQRRNWYSYSRSYKDL